MPNSYFQCLKKSFHDGHMIRKDYSSYEIVLSIEKDSSMLIVFMGAKVICLCNVLFTNYSHFTRKFHINKPIPNMYTREKKGEEKM